MPTGASLVSLIPIRNMNRAIKFYTKALGARLVYRGRGSMRDSWASLSLADGDIWLVTPEKREKRELAYNVLMVKNIKSYVKKLQKNGVKFQRAERMGPDTKIDGVIAIESFGSAAMFKDSEGNLIMVWQYNPAM